MTKPIEIVAGSGNVFADLGLEDAEELRLRVDILFQIRKIVTDGKYKQAKVADMLGIKQPHVSELMNGRLTRFSLERLLKFLTVLGKDVEIVVRDPKKKRPGELTLAVQ